MDEGDGDGDGGLGWAGKTEVECACGTRQVFPVRRKPVPCSQTLESRTGELQVDGVHGRQLIDSVCHNTSFYLPQVPGYLV